MKHRARDDLRDFKRQIVPRTLTHVEGVRLSACKPQKFRQTLDRQGPARTVQNARTHRADVEPVEALQHARHVPAENLVLRQKVVRVERGPRDWALQMQSW